MTTCPILIVLRILSAPVAFLGLNLSIIFETVFSSVNKSMNKLEGQIRSSRR